MNRVVVFTLAIVLLLQFQSLVQANEFTCNQTLVTISTNNFWSKYWNPILYYLNDYYIELSENKPNVSGKENPVLLTAYWTYAMALDTMIDAWEREQVLLQPPTPQQNSFTSIIDTMVKGQSIRLLKWQSEYVDDMNWMAMALVRILRNNIPLKTYSQQQIQDIILDMYQNYIANQWDTTCCGNYKGGVWWDRTKKTQKATASNAGPVVLAATLYDYFLSKNQTRKELLSFALQVYSFWYNNMVNPKTYQVFDHLVAATGERVDWKFSYNEGLMVGAGVTLYRVTQDKTFLQQAITFAKFIMNNETSLDKAGNPIIEDPAPCAGDCMEFKGIAMRYLNILYSELKISIPNHPFIIPLQKFLQDNINAIQQYAFNPKDFMFSVSWLGEKHLSSPVMIYQSQNNCALMPLLLLCR